MTLNEVKTEIDQRLSEFTDGHVVIGFHATTGELIMSVKANDEKTIMALNQGFATMAAIVMQGGLGVLKEPPASP